MLLAFRTAQLGNNFITVMMLVIGSLTFHMTTLEEYYVGELYLPVFNAVSDGSVWVVLFYLASAIWGNDIWVKNCADASWMGLSGVDHFTVG